MQIFYVDKETSKKCYILGARELHIQWSNNSLYWSWNRQPFIKSRFDEVAELRTTWWLEIRGRINTKLLSPRTHYFAYLLVKFADRAYGLHSHPSEASIRLNSLTSQSKVYLHNPNSKRVSVNRDDDADGWIEIELGKFYVNELGDGDVEMCLKEVENQHLRGGLVVDGIQLRPKL